MKCLATKIFTEIFLQLIIQKIYVELQLTRSYNKLNKKPELTLLFTFSCS